MLRLLCVTAHPDDEAGAFGGTLLLYASRGVETHLVCLTSGQAATHRGDARDDDELAAIRRRELGRSAEILRLTSWECLHYPDGALDRQDFYSVVGELVRRIRTIRPHVVLTIGPEGAVTAHPDHSMVSVFTTMAYQWAARSNRYTDQLDRGLQPHRAQKLYYGASLFTLPGRQPISPAPVTAVIEVGQEFVERKISAFKAHTSQAPLAPIFEKAVRQRGTRESFHLAATTSPREIERETDLFAGVKDEDV
ncbi:MAG TPA: PIG-L family deacetylase [Terriglobales bacterium]|nr:PIG-L family deacetylase [Terriglobales bacterium]